VRKGFTLIELMIVVVIIGVLAAIAIPKFDTVQKQARSSGCRGNMRTLATAEATYFPVYGCFTDDITNLDLIQQNASRIRCPSNPRIGAYTLATPTNNDYTVVCPDNGATEHGSIASGISSWQGDN